MTLFWTILWVLQGSVDAGVAAKAAPVYKMFQEPIYQLESVLLDGDEVVDRDYQLCVKAKKCKPPKGKAKDPLDPARNVSWYDAKSYCQFVGKRLPTSKEWRQAAFMGEADVPGRGFGPPRLSPRYQMCDVLAIAGYAEERCEQKRTGPEPMDPDQDAACRGQCFDDANGIHFLFGNVAEWVEDADGDAGIPSYMKMRMILGSSYKNLSGMSSHDARWAFPSDRFPDVGFRCAADVKPTDLKK